ncbi:MAG TPA: hypothetical protein VIP70_07010 [Nitrososphaeraceae archaeon]
MVLKKNSEKENNIMSNKNKQREDKKRVGKEEEKISPYVRDKALNEANNKRFGEKIRHDPYNTTGNGYTNDNP